MNVVSENRAPERVIPQVVLSSRHVSKTYPRRDVAGTSALADISLQATQGEFVALLGPSGCGKTTVLKICTGLIKPTSGIVDYKGTGRPVQPGGVRHGVQSAALLPWRTVLSDVELSADVLGRDGTAARARAKSLLELVHLGDWMYKHPRELSGGMQQRASIARALLHDPGMLLMDEPFGALDAVTREEMGEELQHIHQNQRKTVILVTHSIQKAVLLADRIFVMSRSPNYEVNEFVVPLPRPRSIHDSTKSEFREIEDIIHRAL
jgi:NitT/TauT family transport system ATP-binding protein